MPQFYTKALGIWGNEEPKREGQNSFPVSKTEGMRSFWLLYLPKAVNGYCVNWLASFFFFSPSPHGPYGFHARTQTHLELINCLLISYLISKRVRVNTFTESVLFLIVSPSKRNSHFCERSCFIWKHKMKNVLLLKISLLVQIGEEIYISNFMLQSLHNEGLFMVWRWGIPGRWGNPLRRGGGT